MPTILSELESRRTTLVGAFAALGDFRAGSIVGAVRRCGKPTCHCAQAEDPGHGPSLRLTHKKGGKTITEALSTPGAVRKAEREVAEFRKFQRVSQEFVEVNARLCRERPVEEPAPTAQEKKRRKRSARKSHGR